ncbi:aldose epimerase family protein [Ligilactobacillus salivarius]|uniref:aldose epimerase family protein n=1 Tax=Ligilactobacillus salivarius TaxID=1624 RepID=UPI0030FCA9F5
MIEEHFGYIGNKEISKYILKNKQQTRVGILNLAGIIQEFSIVVNSKRKNLVVNFDTPDEYVENNFQICKQIGRVAGRIKGASFELDNMQYTLEANEGSNALHGGSHGLSTQILDAKITGNTLILFTRLKHEVDGYPGDIDLEISYSLDDDNCLSVGYKAKAIGSTVFDPTVHVYWKLPQGLKNSKLVIPTGQHVETDMENIPTGNFDTNEKYNLQKEKYLSNVIEELRSDEIAGLDDIYKVDASDNKAVARLANMEDNINIDIFSNRNGLIVFTADPIDVANHDKGIYNAVATEAQTVSDSLHHPDFGDIRLYDGQEKNYEIKYKVSIV